MTLFLSTNEFQILKEKKKNTMFTIDFHSRSESLINSIIMTNQILGATVSDDYKSITFNAISVKSFSKYQNDLYKNQGTKNMDYENTLRLISCLTNQIQHLIIEESLCFYLYDPENLIVINDSKFIYLSNTHLMKISEQFIQIERPFSCTGFFSPEIMKITKIPSRINYKTIYHSLAALAVFALFNVNITNIDKVSVELYNILSPIEATKMYWLLLRCLDSDVERRCILYV